MHKLFAAFGVSALLLSACTTGKFSDEARAASLCQSYASLLSTAALNKDQLSSEEIATVNEVRKVINPICTNLDETEINKSTLAKLRAYTRKLEFATDES